METLFRAHRALQKDHNDLIDLWHAVKGQWRDEVGIQYEKEHWRPNQQAVDEYLRALNEMADVLDRAESAIR